MKILVIRFLAIGDVVLTSTLCNTLKKSFPNAQIDYFVHEVSSSLLEGHPGIDNIIELSMTERKNPFKYFLKIWKISKQNYDVIIDTSSTPKSEFISLFSRKTKFRIGREKPYRGFSYTHKIPLSELQGDKISQRLAMLKPLKDAGHKILESPRLSLYFSDEEKNKLHERMKSNGIDFNRPIFAYSVSAKDSQKRWNSMYTQEVIAHCLKKYNAQIILYSGLPHEYIDTKNIYRKLGKPEDVFININTDNLRELGALFCNCDIFIGNEGGPRHIAHAVGIPTATVFSPKADLDIWLPEKGERHIGIQWKDVVEVTSQQKPTFKHGDSCYFRLYNSIKAEHFIPIVDKVIRNTEIISSKAASRDIN